MRNGRCCWERFFYFLKSNGIRSTNIMRKWFKESEWTSKLNNTIEKNSKQQWWWETNLSLEGKWLIWPWWWLALVWTEPGWLTSPHPHRWKTYCGVCMITSTCWGAPHWELPVLIRDNNTLSISFFRCQLSLLIHCSLYNSAILHTETHTHTHTKFDIDLISSLLWKRSAITQWFQHLSH